MAVLDAYSQLTALEQVKRSGNEDQRRIIEELTKTNELLLDAPVVEANDRTVNTALQRTFIPHASHRVYNQGVDAVATQTKTVHDYMCQLMAYSDVDVDLANAAANKDQFIMDECAGIIQGMGEDQADDLIYGDHSANAEYCDGLATRRPSLAEGKCIDLGGTTAGGLTSLYIVKWSRMHTKLIYPKGATGCGVQRTFKGIQTVTDKDGKRYEAYQNIFKADYGLACSTDKSIIRLANIDITKTAGDDILKAIIKAVPHLIKGDGNIVVYSNADVFSLLDLAIIDKGNVNFQPNAPYGDAPLQFRGMKFRQVDALLNTEDQVQ